MHQYVVHHLDDAVDPAKSLVAAATELVPEDESPMGARVYRKRPYGVKKVVSRLASSVRRICQYPFVASNVAKYRLDFGMDSTAARAARKG